VTLGQRHAFRDALVAWCVEQRSDAQWPVDVALLFGEAGPERLRSAWPEFAAFVDRAIERQGGSGAGGARGG